MGFEKKGGKEGGNKGLDEVLFDYD